jgi:HK97 gp10 family phage protein
MSVEISIKIENIDKIKRTFLLFPNKMIIGLNKAIQASVLKVESETKKEAPVNKQPSGGNLRQSIRSGVSGLGSGFVIVNAQYGLYVHEGTRPHVIRIVNKRVLANKRTGQFFGTKVNHPGTRANPFLQRAVDNSNVFIQEQFNKALDDAIK